MKTTKQDSKTKQDNEASVAKNMAQQTESNQSPNSEALSQSADPVMPLDTEQLTLELLVAESLAMVMEEDTAESKKRKDKDDEEEHAKGDKEVAVADNQDATGGQIVTEKSTVGEVLAKESAVDEVLLEQSESVEAKADVPSLPLTTLALGTLGLFGASSYYKNSNKDTAPVFTSGTVASEIAENIGAGQAIYTAVAVDDVSESESITYSLTDESDPGLNINPSSGVVTLSENPDYEIKSQYNFVVQAADAAGNQSEQAVKLVVTNLDDKNPIITSESVAASIDENSGSGQVIYTATADDSADVSGGVSFSLSADSDSALSIDAATGAVTLAADPDFETQSEYNFSVIATDAAGNASDAKPVSLSINNLDEVSPVITSGSVAASIDENSGSGQVIYTATVDDSADVSGGVSFSLSADSDSALSIDAATGAVTLASDPDFETQSEYNFSVIATDAAGNASDAKPVSLSINNLDEVSPVITSGSVAASIDENSGSGQVIYTATVDDSADVSGGVSFSLSADSDSALSIDAATGAVTLAADPDFETQSEYNFSVIATDAAGNASDAKPVSLSINNLDEVSPVITSSSIAASIDENSGSGQVIYTATADDSADVSGGVSFSLSADSDSALSIDAATGAVTLAADPDFETQSEYSFSVIATDAAGNASDAKPVSLSINNLDEVSPVITSGSVAASIDENSGSGQVIYTATADDSADVSGGVSFSLSAVQ